MIVKDNNNNIRFDCFLSLGMYKEGVVVIVRVVAWVFVLEL